MTSDLKQAEADALLQMPKFRADEMTHRFPDPGGKCTAELRSEDARELFLLDLNRSAISLTKITYQTRGRISLVLARLDLDGAPHRNPDDEEVPSPHLHLYREGYGDKWAYPVPSEAFSNLSDRWETLLAFMNFCHVVQAPNFERGLLT